MEATNRILIISLVSALCLISTPSEGEESVCKETGSKNKVHMDNISDYVGFCGLHAMRASIHQLRCKVDPDNCVLPSILEIVKADKELPRQNDDYAKLLQQFGTGRPLKDESCIPFDGFFKHSSRELPTWDWSNRYAFYSFKAMKIELEPTSDVRKDNNSLIEEMLGITEKDTQAFIKLKTESRFKTALDNYVGNKKCEPRKTPEFRVKRTMFSPANLQKQLLDGDSVLVPLEVAQPGTSIIGPHEILVTNFRKTCCLQRCVTQYQVIDSLDLYWVKGQTANMWISEKDLTDAVSKHHPSIVWPEAGQKPLPIPENPAKPLPTDRAS